MIQWLTQPDKEQRANKYIDRVTSEANLKQIWFKQLNRPFYYPKSARWIDFCQTVDECFNPHNWHHFITKETPIGQNDIVVDCGAAEGLFSYVAAFKAKKAYAVEPVPSWHSAMKKTFAEFDNVETVLSHRGIGKRSDQAFKPVGLAKGQNRFKNFYILPGDLMK